VPRWATNNDRAIAALTAAVGRIGRCVLVAHSHGGGISAHVAMSNPELVAGAVLLEPHGLPSVDRGATAGPQVIIVGDNVDESDMYTALKVVWTNYVDGATRGGVNAEIIALPELGVFGNSHNMMMDVNSDAVAGIVRAWISQNIEQPAS
jgi:pimeloyl-ACP methyl ester carboxylesterase